MFEKESIKIEICSKVKRNKREERGEKMDSSSQEGEEKKKITEVKTFAVPFALGEIKTNISINTNRPSKEQIIKQFNYI